MPAGLTEHLPHLLMLVAPLLVFAALFVLEWRRQSPAAVPTTLRVMAGSAAASGAVHGAVTGHHASEAAALGWFFALLCLAQLSWALLVVALPVRRVVVAGVLGHLAVVGLWAWTRAVGVPLGLEGAGPEPVGALDLLATGLEVAAVVAGLLWAYRATGGRPSPLVLPWSKCETSTTRKSPPPRKVSTPSGARPSQETNSLRPSNDSTFATRS